MNLLDFQSNPVSVNLTVFAVGAIIVWMGGVRLARYADVISDRTGLGHAFVGMLLLGGITSLPELATTISASMAGNASLAVNNILGGVAMQIAILAVADAVLRRRTLTRVVEEPVILLQGVLLVAALALVGIAVTVGDRTVAGLGVWTTAILIFVVLGLYLIKRYEDSPAWKPTSPLEEAENEFQPPERKRPLEEMSTRGITIRTIAAGCAIMAAGSLVALTADTLAEQTNLGSSFMGAVAVAIATSLPEVSTTLGAIKIRRYRLAFSNIFGTNLFDIGILFFADLVYRRSAVLNEVGAFSQLAVLLGILLTVTYIGGIIERSDRSIFGIGYDSMLVLALYAGGLVLLYTMR